MNLSYHFFNSNLNNPKLLNVKKNKQWENISGEDFLNTIKLAALGLGAMKSSRQLPFKPGELVGLISPSNPTWLTFSHSMMASHMIPVPVFVNISPTNLKYQINETRMKYIFICGEEALNTVKPFLSKFKKAIYHDIPTKSIPAKYKKIFLPFSKIIELGKKKVKQQKKDTFLADLKKIKSNQPAVIIYTSGSTGEPKGVMLTHANLLHQVESIKEFYPLVSGRDYAVSCLPLSHVFEYSIINLFISLNLSIYFSPNLNQLGEIIREIRPTVMTVVPRILGKVYEKMSSSPQLQKGLKKILVANAVKYAEDHPLPKNSLVKPSHSLLYPIYDKLVYRKFREALGNNVRVLVNGGAALPHRILRFFRNIGINVVEGYGLTETSPVIAANHLNYNKPYTVGPLLSGVEVKILDGEVLTKSPSVMKGYFKKPKLTKEVMKQGWFMTGDLGEIDDEGNLIITGRKKDLYKLSNGKYLAPLPLEQKLELCPCVDIAMVVGDDRKYTSALVFMNTEINNREKSERELREYIKEINTSVNPWEKIVRHKAIWKKLSIDEGDITPKMNIRRGFMLKKYAKDIDELY